MSQKYCIPQRNVCNDSHQRLCRNTAQAFKQFLDRQLTHECVILKLYKKIPHFSTIDERETGVITNFFNKGYKTQDRLYCTFTDKFYKAIRVLQRIQFLILDIVTNVNDSLEIRNISFSIQRNVTIIGIFSLVKISALLFTGFIHKSKRSQTNHKQRLYIHFPL